MKKTDISGALISKVTTQDYTPSVPIEGVKVIELKNLLDDGGSFAELYRLDKDRMFEDFPDFSVAQINYSSVDPSAVKAFHLHFNQEDIWFVPPEDRLLIGLYDVRAGSKTEGKTMRFVAGGGRARLIYIPRGVAHGCANVWQKPGAIIYFTNQHFSPTDTDENRIPWDSLGEDFWKITNG